EVGAEVLAHVTAGEVVGELDAEPDAARHHRDLARADPHRAQLSVHDDRAELRYEQQLAVGVDEVAVPHALAGSVQVDGDPVTGPEVAVAPDSEQAVD